MKKVFAIVLALGLALALTACGGASAGSDENALVAYEAGAISIALPADMQPVEVAEGYAFKGENSTVSITELQEVADSPADVTEDLFYGNAENSGMSNVTVSDFANDAAIGGGTAAMAVVSGDTSSGSAVTMVMIYYFPADGQMSSINLLYMTDAGSALEQNVQAVIDSIALN